MAKVTMSKGPSRPTPASRPVKHFSQPAPMRAKPGDGSTATSREAVRKAKNPGQINPRQQNF